MLKKYLKKACVITVLITTLLFMGCDQAAYNNADNGGDGDSSGAGNPVITTAADPNTFDNATFDNATFQ